MGRMNVGQIKISGQRLELGEIEATIFRTGLATSAGAVCRKSANGGDPSLLAYVVVNREQKTNVDDRVSNDTTQAATSNGDSAVVDTWKDVYDDMYATYDL